MPKEGGLVLKTKDLKRLLKFGPYLGFRRPRKVVGLAFVLDNPSSVNLHIYRVYLDKKHMFVAERVKEPIGTPMSKAVGASNPESKSTDVPENFRFGHNQELIDSKFVFGFYYKALFDIFLKDGYDRVFISGCKISYPNPIQDSNHWFTLGMKLLKSESETSPRKKYLKDRISLGSYPHGKSKLGKCLKDKISLGSYPHDDVMIACPPQWVDHPSISFENTIQRAVYRAITKNKQPISVMDVYEYRE